MNERSSLTPKTAVITGAARGIGAAIATRLARDGFSLLLLDLNPEVLNVAEQLPSAKGHIVDLSKESVAREIAELAGNLWDGVDALVNNAALPGPSRSVQSLTRDDVLAVFGVNVLAASELCRELIPSLVERGGAIVNVGSLFADYPVPNGAAYSMSKSAVKNLTQVLALELGPAGVRVNAVAPGYILTDMHLEEVAAQALAQGKTPEARLLELQAEVPLRRHGTPAEVADVVSWLLSHDSRYVHGQTIAINGGLTFS